VVVRFTAQKFEREGFGVEAAPDGLVALKMLAAVNLTSCAATVMMPNSMALCPQFISFHSRL